MKAVDIKGGKGPSENLFIADVERPSPGKNEVLVKVHAFGLNRMDIIQRNGNYPLPPQAPKTLGVEFAGIVEEIGEGETEFKKGDKVFGLAYGGAYAEYIAVSARMIMAMPSELDYEHAAGLPEVWFTAIQALYVVCGIQKGDRVLIHAGASGVGIAAIQLAVAAGAKAVYTTAGSKEKCDFLHTKIGATRAINYKEEKFDEIITKDTNGEGVNVIVDFVGKNYWTQNMTVAAKEARMVLLAFMSGAEFQGDLKVILYKRLRIEGSTLRSRDLEYQANLKKLFLDLALPHLRSKKFSICVDKVFSWKDIKDAHDYMESNQSMGKIICKVD